MAVTPHRLEEVINKKAAFIITDARKLTPIADRSAIESAFQVATIETTSKKTGKVRRKILKLPSIDAPKVALVIWRLRLRGKDIPSHAELLQLAESLPGRRLRAVGSLRQGWRNALRRLAAAAAISADAAGPAVHHGGTARPATAGWNPLATWEYQLATNPPGSPPSSNAGDLGIDPRVETALAEAFAHETASMEQYIHDHLQPDADQINAK
jgi:hypothetical protein